MSDDGNEATPASQRHIRVMTLNLLSPEHADWNRRRPVLQAGLAALRPDVIALQETVLGSGYDQAADLLGPDYQVARHPAPSADGVGAPTTRSCVPVRCHWNSAGASTT